MPGELSYGKNLLIALDQLLNALIGGFCDETLSSRSYRWDVAGKRHWPRRCIDRIAAILGDRNHCEESFISEREGRQLPPEARPDRKSGNE